MKKKLKISDLKVSSFVTDLGHKNGNALMGASYQTCTHQNTACPTCTACSGSDVYCSGPTLGCKTCPIEAN